MNARIVSKFDVRPADGAFTRILNTCHLRNSHSPVEVHASECVTCDQHRYFRANSLKTYIGTGSFSPYERAVEVEIRCDAR
jgi:hypothetical protein